MMLPRKRLLMNCFVTTALLLPHFAKAESEPFSVDLASVAERIGSGDPVAGKRKSKAEVCQECHGELGRSTSPAYPNLAGQYAQYIRKQLRDFQTGARKHAIMTGMASGIGDTDAADIAAFFASNTQMQGAERRSEPIAESLFSHGDAARNIPPCAGCHGATGKGAVSPGMATPVIGGQRREYLLGQLLDWRLGARQNSPGGVMNAVAVSLSDDEIEALANYASGL
jgi:cytochrome c553